MPQAAWLECLGWAAHAPKACMTAAGTACWDALSDPHEFGVQAGRELSSLLQELVGFELCTPHGWCTQSLSCRMQATAGKLGPHTSRAEEELGALESPRSGAVDMEAAGRKLLCPGTAIHPVSPSLQSGQLCCAEHLHAEWHLHCTARLCAAKGNAHVPGLRLLRPGSVGA